VQLTIVQRRGGRLGIEGAGETNRTCKTTELSLDEVELGARLGRPRRLFAGDEDDSGTKQDAQRGRAMPLTSTTISMLSSSSYTSRGG
jgi:hypothetical protein